MVGKIGVKRKRIKPRNPLVPVVRGLRPKVEASPRAYTRKAKHKTRNESNDDPKV